MIELLTQLTGWNRDIIIISMAFSGNFIVPLFYFLFIKNDEDRSMLIFSSIFFGWVALIVWIAMEVGYKIDSSDIIENFRDKYGFD